MHECRGNRFETEYLPCVQPFSAVIIASSAKRDELAKYLDIARIADLVDLATSSDDAEEIKTLAGHIRDRTQEAEHRRYRRRRDR